MAPNQVEEGVPHVDNADVVEKNRGGAVADGDDGVPLPVPTDVVASSTNDEPLFQFLTGMKEDFALRAPLYRNDWSKPRSVFTVINATVFTFVIQLIPAIIFAELMARETENNLAVAEVLLSSAIMGVIYAIFAGQPLVIMGITGPVAILLGTSYRLTATFDAEYFPFFFWVCIWAGVMHIVSAMVGLVNLVWKVTPFTSQIFELFIGISFIFLSLRDLVEPLALGEESSSDRSSQYATLLLGILTYYISWTLHFAETWVLFSRQVRMVLTSYNTLFAVVIATALSYIPGLDQGGALDRVDIEAPWDWRPTADRPWVTSPLQGMSVTAIFGAMIPGFMFFLLFIIDHNVSSILSQVPKYNLKKPPAYHVDFFILGLTFIPCAILGLPPGNGLIPQAPLHVRALCTRKIETDTNGIKREVVTHCEEQRWSGLGQALLMFVALSAFAVVGWIPRGALFGLLLYLGAGALHGNEIWERLIFCFMMAKKRPPVPVVTKVKKWSTVVSFTLIQLACAVAIFAVANFSSVGYIYPVLLVVLVPIRSYVLSKIFSEEDLKHLDPHGEEEEEEDRYLKEQHIIHSMRSDDFDAEDVEFHNRAEFRGQGRRHSTSFDDGNESKVQNKSEAQLTNTTSNRFEEVETSIEGDSLRHPKAS